jgi:peptidoglycan glycosyltransferase
MVTPFAMARLVATIARGGTVPRPYVVEQILGDNNRSLWETELQDIGQAIHGKTASQVAGMMSAVVEKGTGGMMHIPGVRVAAKTGTAQKAQGRPDVWMLAFAPIEQPTVAVAVVVEGGESGGETAGPIAREVMRALLGG